MLADDRGDGKVFLPLGAAIVSMLHFALANKAVTRKLSPNRHHWGLYAR